MSGSPAPLRVLVVDDEPQAREDLARLIRRRTDAALAGVCSTGAEAIAAVKTLSPDVLLLDSRVPGLDAFHVLAQLDPAPIPYVVFVTAFDRAAVDDFRIRALDYVLKPVKAGCLDDALMRARDRLRVRAMANGGDRTYWSEIIVRVGPRRLVVRVNDIAWVEADTYYVRLHVGTRHYLFRERMHVMDANLDPLVFVRVHRSAIVNMNHVREIRHDERGEHMVVLSTGRRIKTSRSRWLRFRAAMRSRSRPDLV